VTQNVEMFVQALESSNVTRLFAVTSLVRSILSYLEMDAKMMGRVEEDLVKMPKLSKVGSLITKVKHSSRFRGFGGKTFEI
jgi:hypothetical protein